MLTRWTDNDMFGHLNNAVYYELFDTAINGWINTSCGIDPLNVPWLGVVAESGCRYFAELKFPDPLFVGLAGPARQQQRHLPAGILRRRPRRRRRPLGACLRRPDDPPPGADPRHDPRAAGKASSDRPVDMLVPMPLVSKTVEVDASAEAIMAIVADFESYPEWNDEIKGCWVLARYDDGRPSQLRLDVVVQGQSGTFITAVYYPAENQIYTVLQQGEHFEKQEQRFSVVPIGATSLLTVDLDVETKLPIPQPMVKKAIGDTLDYLAGNLKTRAEQLAAS